MRVNKIIDITRAWKDADYRASLTAEELATLPENPIGAFELSESDLVQTLGASVGAAQSAMCTVCNTATPCVTRSNCNQYTYPYHSMCTSNKPYACWN